MDFKKDLSKLAYICPTGSGRLVTLENPYFDGTQIQLFLSGGIGMSTSIFDGKDILDHLELISNKFLSIQEKANKELAKKGEKPNEITPDSFYENLLQDAIKGNKYVFSEFSIYEMDTIGPVDETQGLNIDFMKKMATMFDSKIQYHFTKDYIVGTALDQKKVLFVVPSMPMVKQLRLEVSDTSEKASTPKSKK